jgi:hypothetical protein
MKIKAAILAILLGASTSLLHAQQAPKPTLPETAPQQPPMDNWLSVSTPGITALAKPESFLQYGPNPNCGCCPGKKSGSCVHRLIEWATYCPKERIGCCHCCTSCQYKGVLPYYQFFLRCQEGSGLHATFTHPCYQGCKDCAAATPCAAK